MSKEEEILIAKTVQTVVDGVLDLQNPYYRILLSDILKMLVEKLLDLMVSA